MRNSDLSNRRLSDSPLDGLDRRPKNILGHTSTRIKPADRHGHGVALAGRLLPEWRNGNLQYPRRVFKRGMVFGLTIGSALFNYRD